MADPAPVAQTFFVEQEIGQYYLLDAIITVVDAKHAIKQLDDNHEAEEQVGFADRLLLSKTDLVSPAEVAELEARLRAINARAPIAHAHFGETDISEILDIRGFNLNAILEIEPDFLEDVSHEHDAGITSFVYRTDKAFDAARIIAFMDVMMRDYGNDLLRYKGIVHIAGCDRKIIYQGVHMLLADSFGVSWAPNEIRQSVFVFIGRNLPKQAIHEALNSCRVI